MCLGKVPSRDFFNFFFNLFESLLVKKIAFCTTATLTILLLRHCNVLPFALILYTGKFPWF